MKIDLFIVPTTVISSTVIPSEVNNQYNVQHTQQTAYQRPQLPVVTPYPTHYPK